MIWQSIQRLGDPRVMKELGDEIRETVQVRTRSGFGLSEEGNREVKFPKLSKDYVKHRNKMKLSPNTTPSKSNLHKSGEMIEGLKVNAKTNKTVILNKNQKQNIKLEYQTSKRSIGTPFRKFMGLSGRDEKKVVSFLLDKLVKILKSRRL